MSLFEKDATMVVTKKKILVNCEPLEVNIGFCIKSKSEMERKVVSLADARTSTAISGIGVTTSSSGNKLKINLLDEEISEVGGNIDSKKKKPRTDRKTKKKKAVEVMPEKVEVIPDKNDLIAEYIEDNTKTAKTENIVKKHLPFERLERKLIDDFAEDIEL